MCRPGIGGRKQGKKQVDGLAIQGIEGDGPVGQVSADSYSVKDKGDRIEFRGRVRTRVNPE